MFSNEAPGVVTPIELDFQENLPSLRTHPIVHKENHTKLLRYVTDRIKVGAAVRDAQVGRFAEIDKQVAGWMRKSPEDKQRIKDQVKNGIPKATLQNLPLTFIHLDDLVTYFSSIFAPGKSMFYQAGKPDEVKPAQQIVQLMNNHAIYSGYYRELYQGVWAMLKYNLGGYLSAWESEMGPKLDRAVDGTIQTTEEEIWAGNKVMALDMYNTMFDPCVHPTMVHKEGEWAGRVRLRSHFWLTQRAAWGIYSNVKDVLTKNPGQTTCKWFRSPPAEADMDMDESTNSSWVSRLSDTPNQFKGQGYEIVEVYIRLNPVQFGLVPAADKAKRNKIEIWRISLLGDERIIEATPMNNVHNHIPYYFGLVNDDGMDRQQKSVAEIIAPFQNFASHLMNIHIQASRKKLFGMTFYDKSVVDFSKIPEGEVAGHIPVEPTGQGKIIRDSIYRDDTQVDTERTMADLAGVMDLTNQFFPTQAMPSQIAGIDRAVSNQVSAVQQGVNRRQQKAAMLLDSTCLRPMRFGLYYNILQYQPDNETITDYRGREVQIDLSALKKTDLPFIIGMGLKAIDKQAVAEKLQQVLFALIQNPQSAAQIDVLAMIDYWTDMMDIDIDMNQFKIELPPEGQVDPNAPVQEGTGVTPATNPQAVTQPIYG